MGQPANITVLLTTQHTSEPVCVLMRLIMFLVAITMILMMMIVVAKCVLGTILPYLISPTSINESKDQNITSKCKTASEAAGR